MKIKKYEKGSGGSGSVIIDTTIDTKDFKNNNNKIIFLEKVKTALKNGWAGSTQEKNDFIELIRESENGDEEAFKMLENVFKFNDAFKKETGLFKNV